MADTLIQGTTIIEDKRSEKGEIWSASGIDFTGRNPDTNDVTMSSADEGTILASADNITFVAPVHLPNGTTITSAVVYGNAAATAETWVLYRMTLNSRPGTSSAETVASGNIGTEDTSISNAIINNDAYCYWFQTSSLDTNDAIFGARIIYTY